MPPRLVGLRDAPRAVHGWIDALSALLWPSRCLVCREAGVAGRDLCPACAAALPCNRSACVRCAIPLPGPVPGMPFDGERMVSVRTCGDCLSRPPPLTATHATFVYGAPIDGLLLRFKFHQDLAAGRVLVQRMLDAAGSLPGLGADDARADALIPIPLHRARLRQRGYDQALELARPLSRALGIALRDDLLRRHRATQPQSSLDATQRRHNVRGAFVVSKRPADVGSLPAYVVLIDDVMTTGATLHAAAVALHRAGVARVDAWVCARVP
ncbi:MAG: double zinc ribbon domain-containing protein [Luteimonas sp.]